MKVSNGNYYRNLATEITQNAMDNFQYIRENFGPHFKHKYSIETNTWNYNHPVSGHKDHIHIAVRR